jgi:RNA polymerase sigma-70 factor (ECF subfamily)
VAVKPFSASRHEWGTVPRPSSHLSAEPDGAPAPLDFDAVYQAHAQTVARWVTRLGGTGIDVEDTTQEIFMIVSRRLHEFRGASRMSTWLFSITAKVVANDRRKRRVRRWWLRLMPNAGHETVALTDSPLEGIERRERRLAFYQALDGLTERQRRALVLFELEELSAAEIADMMDMTAGNVRVLLHRARAAFLKRTAANELRQALGNQGER